MVHEYGCYGYKLNETLPAEKNAYGPLNSTTWCPVLCYCQNYGVCGCDDFNETSPTNSGLNSTVVPDEFKWNTSYALINGTGYSLLNGTLANGTTAPGGTENSGTSLGGKRALGMGWASIVVVGTYLII